jgi:hypothetical protein
MGLVIIGGGALLTGVAVRIRHSRAKPGEATDNDLTGVFVLLVTGMYGVLAAFMIFTVWTTYDNAQQAASAEGGGPRGAGPPIDRPPPAGAADDAAGLARLRHLDDTG